MRGVYTATHKATVNAAGTLLYLTAPSTMVVELLSAKVTCGGANEMLEFKIERISTLGTPTKTDVTECDREEGDQAPSTTAHAIVTASEPTYEGTTGVYDHAFAPSQAGYVFDPTPEERPTIKPGGSVGIRLISTPTSQGMVVQATWREIG